MFTKFAVHDVLAQGRATVGSGWVKWSPRHLPGGSNVVFWLLEIFSGTHPHVAIEATSELYYILKLGLGVCFLLSFISDLWTPRNVALMILTPYSQK